VRCAPHTGSAAAVVAALADERARARAQASKKYRTETRISSILYRNFRSTAVSQPVNREESWAACACTHACPNETGFIVFFFIKKELK
jgi:hypothetical protein